MNFPRLGPAIAVLAILLSAGCTAVTPPAAPEPVAPPPEPAVLEIIEVPPPEPPRPDPRDLLGMTGEEVALLLGPPGLLRKEPPAEVWRYSGARCLLHLFLYPEDEGPNFKVSHYEALTRDAAPTSADICYIDLIEARTID